MYSSSRNPCRKASMLGAYRGKGSSTRCPIRGIFVGCCASAAGKRKEHTAKRKTNNFHSHEFSLLVLLCSLPFAPCSLLFNDFIRPRQHGWWNRQADLLCGLEVDCHLIERLDSQILRMSTCYDFLNILCLEAIYFMEVLAIAGQATLGKEQSIVWNIVGNFIVAAVSMTNCAWLATIPPET
jgi:hypothetical protein